MNEQELIAKVKRLHELVEASTEFMFSEPHADEVYIVKQNGFNRWELHVSEICGGGLIEVYEGTDARERAIAEARKRAGV